MKDKIQVDQQYFYERLEQYLKDRHPHLAPVKSFIDMRSRRALKTYRQNILDGLPPLSAKARADEVLYSSLIFSRFDTLRCILATEYPDIPSDKQRSIALEMEVQFENIFRKYKLDDNLIQRREYNHLIAELITAIDVYFSQTSLYIRYCGRSRTNKE